LKLTWGVIFLIVYLALVAIASLTNIQVVWMGALTGLAALLAAIGLAFGK
jgi:hypothetical protein